MKVLYMGTPDFAVPPLKSIINAGHSLCGVFTQPDKPKGRGYTLTPPPVKECALENNIEVFQPATLKDGTALDIIKKLNPDVIVVVAFGKILPKEILDFPKYGCINIHGSLLPRYRGAAPIQWSVLNGDKQTGVTAMYMDVGVDTGDMLLKEVTDIGENETSEELYDRIAHMGAELIVKTLAKAEKGELVPEKQEDSLSCYAPMLDKSMCKIDWTKSASEVHNKVRGLNSWPIATASINGKAVKIYTTRLCNKGGRAGQIISLKPVTVACGTGSVEILQIQPQGKKRMSAEDFARGYRLTTDSIFE
ncbi:MAG TPA: methionyl-tRNA formyltransferase [Clostridiales bacterium]|nr:methionyl-tRNA formyltransferase [Clostridiales bacterium]